jgi:hypothetical protein
MGFISPPDGKRFFQIGDYGRLMANLVYVYSFHWGFLGRTALRVFLSLFNTEFLDKVLKYGFGRKWLSVCSHYEGVNKAIIRAESRTLQTAVELSGTYYIESISTSYLFSNTEKRNKNSPEPVKAGLIALDDD